MTDTPRLRRLDFQPVTHRGQQMWLLRDPYRLSAQQLIVPPALAQMLIYCDGTRTRAAIHQALCADLGAGVPFDVVEDTLRQLDEACLLDNERAAAATQRQLEQYRSQPHRSPALAGLSYPAEPAALTAQFAAYANDLPPRETTSFRGRGVVSPGEEIAPFRGRGIVSPHIDYGRGGPVYAQVWRQAAPAVLDAELVIILGTDHNGGRGTLTLTRQAYATPYGILPTDVKLIDRLAEAIGPEAAFADELNHRDEHSVELSAVWLHHVFHQAGRAPCPMIPVLVGSFHHFVMDGSHPTQDARLTRFLEALARETAGRRTLIVASVDLAHVGPNFGDRFVMDDPRRDALRQTDATLLGRVLAGDADGFYQQIAGVQDRNRICGFSPIYLMLRHLGSARGELLDYRHCPADPQDTSLVSICGALLH